MYTGFDVVADFVGFLVALLLDILTLLDMKQIKTPDGTYLWLTWLGTILVVWTTYLVKLIVGCVTCSKSEKQHACAEFFLHYCGAWITLAQTLYIIIIFPHCSFYVKLLYSVAAKYRFLWVTLRAIVQGHLVFPDVQEWFRQSGWGRFIYIVLCPCPHLSVALAALYCCVTALCNRDRKMNCCQIIGLVSMWIIMTITYGISLYVTILAFKPSLLQGCSSADLQVKASESYLVLNGTAGRGKLQNLTDNQFQVFNQTIEGTDLLANNLVIASTNCTNVVSRDAEPFYALYPAEHDISECNFTISIALNTATLLPHYNFGIRMVSNGFEHCLETELNNPTVPFSWQSDYFHLVNGSFGPDCNRCNNTNMTQLLTKDILPFLANYSDNVPFFACSSSLECTAGWTNMSALNLWDILLVKVTFGGSQADAVYDNNLPTCLRDNHATDVGAYGLYLPWNIHYWTVTFSVMALVCVLVSAYKMFVTLDTTNEFEPKANETCCRYQDFTFTSKLIFHVRFF